jgi:ABC-type branched-subunit amino acid transport system permease subunit
MAGAALYSRPFDTLVLTWALSLLLRKTVEAIFGLGYKSLTEPLSGTWRCSAPPIRATASCCSPWGSPCWRAWRSGTGAAAPGTRIQAMVDNPDLASAMGLPVSRFASATFVVGTCLAGVAGVLVAPLVPVQPFMGLDHVLMSFFVLVVGGLGSVGGLLAGSTVVGGINSVVSAISDSTGGYFCVLVLAILFLWLRPRGSMRRGSVVAIAALLLLPFVAGDFWAYQMGLLYLYAVAALGVGLCWGRVGFLPLGQGLFFGLSAYLSGLALIAFDASPWLLLLVPLAAATSGALAFVIGMLVFRRRGESGPYFSMITLALALLASQVANNWESVTGGFNGLKGIPGLPGLDSYTAAYYVAASALVIACLAVHWLYQAPLGVLWAALAHNERRVVLFGFDTNRLKAVAFGISGLLAGIGGALYAPQQGLVTPQLCGFLLSADLVIWTAVGGRGRCWGPCSEPCSWAP